jgi:hypothetical protein
MIEKRKVEISMDEFYEAVRLFIHDYEAVRLFIHDTKKIVMPKVKMDATEHKLTFEWELK